MDSLVEGSVDGVRLFEICVSFLELLVEFRKFLVELLDLGGRFRLLISKIALEFRLKRSRAPLMFLELTRSGFVVRAVLFGFSSQVLEFGLSFRRFELFTSLLVPSELLTRGTELVSIGNSAGKVRQ